ncbi:MAG: hypothetical protein FWD68_13995 [Alphaproteobacteria bacterium]|nr:hypothetical protein [Alphaproteobacteria bacterium]
MSAGDLEKILSIKAAYAHALPAIRALCERVLLEDLNAEDAPYLLSGIAAVDGLLHLARHLNSGDDGIFQCGVCGWGYEFVRFGERIAVYADPEPRLQGHPESGISKLVDDYKEGVPARSDGFLVPAVRSGDLDGRITALLVLAERVPGGVAELLVRHFAGSFVCCKCGRRGPVQAVP